MSGYSPLLSIDVEHAFWARPSMALRCECSRASADWLRRRDLLLRPQRHGVALFCQSERRTLLLDELEAGEAMLVLKWYAQDPLFSQYSLPVSAAADQLLYVRSSDSHAEADGVLRLHAEPQIGSAQLQALGTAALAAHLERRDALFKPVLVAAIDLADQVRSAAPQSAVSYVVRFGVRKSVWKYYFISDADVADVMIVDLDDTVNFVAGTPEQLPGNRRALVFTSASEIVMQQDYPQRFQLREQGGLGERILIRRLPNADLRKVTQEMAGGSTGLVSEIYIN